MRGLNKNMYTFYSAKYLGLQKQVDEWEQPTGQYIPKYALPVKHRGNISPNIGSSQFYMFGNLLEYSNVISPLPVDTDIDENSVLWIGIEPNAENDNYNYIVKRIAKSKNFLAIAIGKRTSDED